MFNTDFVIHRLEPFTGSEIIFPVPLEPENRFTKFKQFWLSLWWYPVKFEEILVVQALDKPMIKFLNTRSII